MSRFSEQFRNLSVALQGQMISVDELMQRIGPRAHVILSAFLSLPFIFFLPIPGLSILFGLVIALSGFFVMLKKPLWLPRWIAMRQIKAQTLSNILRRAEKFLKCIEKFAKPRGEWLASHPWVMRFNGCLIFLCGLLLMLPLPPGTNFTPAFTVFLLSLGILEEDLFFVAFGYVAFLLNLALFIAIPIIGIRELTKY